VLLDEVMKVWVPTAKPGVFPPSCPRRPLHLRIINSFAFLYDTPSVLWTSLNIMAAATSSESTTANKAECNASTQTTIPFPRKLHAMLERSDQEGFDHIVSWLPSGNGFKVHDSKAFVETVLPKFFRQTKYKSFQRQCNIWGFERLLTGPHKGGYTHVNLVRGKTNLCSRMKRQKIKGNGIIEAGTVAVAVTGTTTSAVKNNRRTFSTRSISITSLCSCSSNNSVSIVPARSISPSFVPVVEGRNYNSPQFSLASTIRSTADLKTLENYINLPELVHSVPVSPVSDVKTVTEVAPQTGDSIDFEGQNFFFIHDVDFAATTSYSSNDEEFFNQQQVPRHSRRLSLDLFAASRLESDEPLIEMLRAADLSQIADCSPTASSYFY
jgi:hypothetical protein